MWAWERGEGFQVLGRIDVERQRGDRDELHVRAAGSRELQVALRAARAEGGDIAFGGVRTRAFVPVPWRSGTISTDGGVTGCCRSASISAGATPGQSPGTSRTRVAPASMATLTPRPAASLCPVSSSVMTRTACAVAIARASRDPVTTRISSTLVFCSDRSTSVNIASTRASRGRAPSPSRSRCLATEKLLMGRMAKVLTVLTR